MPPMSLQTYFLFHESIFGSVRKISQSGSLRMCPPVSWSLTPWLSGLSTLYSLGVGLLFWGSCESRSKGGWLRTHFLSLINTGQSSILLSGPFKGLCQVIFRAWDKPKICLSLWWVILTRDVAKVSPLSGRSHYL